MFRNSSLVFTTLLIAAVAAPLQASGVTKVSENSRLSAEPQFNVAIAQESSTEETIHVQTWIPGFDDGEPISVCSPILTPKFSVKESWNRTSAVGCGGVLRVLPWISHPVPAGRVHFLLPIL